MAALSELAVLSGTAVTNPSGVGTFSFSLFDRVSYLVTVFSSHATPASLATWTLTSANTTPVLIGTISNTTTTGKRITVWYVRTTSDRASETFTITASNGLTQNANVYVGAWGSAVPTGAPFTNLKTNSTGSGTSLTVTFDNAMTSLNSGCAAFFMSNVSGTAMGNRTGWTERLDAAGANTVTRNQAQIITLNDTAASCTAASGIILGIAVEMVCVTNPVVCIAGETGSAQTLNAALSFTLNFRANTLHLMFIAADRNSPQIATPTEVVFANTGGLTWTLLHTSPAILNLTSAICYAYVYGIVSPIDLTGIPHSISAPSTSSNGYDWFYRKIDVQNVDTTVGTMGIIQTGSDAGGAPHEITMGSAAGDTNGILQAWTVHGLATWTINHGYQTLVTDQPFAGAGGISHISWRANGDTSPASVPGAVGGNQYSGVAFEIAPLPAGDPPVITLITPAEGPIDSDDAITIEVTDPDDDLAMVVVTAAIGDADELVYSGGSLSARYNSSSTATAITDGYSLVILRDSDWPGSLTLTVIATDDRGNVTTDSFSFTVADAATDPCLNPAQPDPVTTIEGMPKLEGMITVPTGGWSISVTETPAATSSVTIAAGNYFPTSPTSLLDALETALNADATLAGTYTVTIDDDTQTSTGKVTIAASGLTSFAITWTSPALRNALGFTATISGAATHTSPSASPHVWLPNVKRWSSTVAPDGYRGQPQTDGTVTISPSGMSKAIKYATRYIDVMEWRFVLGRKAWSSLETITNESYETFYGVAQGRGQPVRYHSDRTDDTTYSSYRHMGIGSMAAVPSIPGFTAGATSLWNLGPNDLLAYVS